MTSTEQMREATKPHLKMTLQGTNNILSFIETICFFILRTWINQWHGNVSW